MKKANTRARSAFCSLMALSCALITAEARADEQTDAQAEAAPDDNAIIVTALKGNVGVQQAPVTVNIVDGEAIAQKGLTSVDQLTAVVPGIRINQAPGGLVNPVVRGLGSSPSNNSFEQTIGLFVDGIFAGHPRDYSAALFDLERVELLKGTQAAVVGKNTSVGALSLVTRKPTFTFGGDASYYHEFELGTDTVTAGVNAPLSDKVAVRLAGVFSDEGGWMKAVFGGPDQPATKRHAIRGTVRFQPTTDLDWTVSAQYSDQRTIGQYFRTGIDTLGRAAANALAAGDTSYVIRNRETRVSDRAGFTFHGLDGIGAKTNGTRFNSTLEYSLGSVTLSSITGYSEYTDKFIIDGSSSKNNPVLRAGYERNKSFSQELRVSTDETKQISLIAGGYYYNDKWFYEDSFDFTGPPVTAIGGAFNSSIDQKTETLSAFGQVTFKPTENVVLSASARFEHFKKSADYSKRTVTRPGGLTAAVYGAYAAFSRKKSDDFFDYALQAQYFITPDVNVYASYSTGTKGFGYVGTPTSPGGVVTNPFFDTEESRTVEAGLKANFAGNSHFNLAFFDTKIKNYQIGINLGTNFLIRNDQIRSRGVEAGVELRMIEGLTASLNATYADVKKLPPLPATPSIARLPFAPRWSGLASLDYARPVSDDLTLKTNVSAEFRSSQQLSDVPTFPIPSVPGRVRTDARIGVEYAPAQLEVALVARNIFDVYALAYGFNQFGATGAAQVSEEMPRTIGVQASIRF